MYAVFYGIASFSYSVVYHQLWVFSVMKNEGLNLNMLFYHHHVEGDMNIKYSLQEFYQLRG